MTAPPVVPTASRLVDRAGWVADWVRAHPRLVVLTGAGVSTASGIPDYRDADGAWKRPPPMTLQAFMGSCAARERYWLRSMLGWPRMAQARPGDAHHAIAAMQRAGHLERLVTQNVDGLHDAAGADGVIDLHGRIDTVRCVDCGQRTPRAALQPRLLDANPRWGEAAAPAAPDGDADVEPDASGFAVPACAACGGILKPDVVFFGENVPRERVEAVREAVARSDALLVVGSSLMVWSGLRFVQAAADAGKPVAAINQGVTRADGLLAWKASEDAGAFLSALVANLR